MPARCRKASGTRAVMLAAGATPPSGSLSVPVVRLAERRPSCPSTVYLVSMARPTSLDGSQNRRLCAHLAYPYGIVAFPKADITAQAAYGRERWEAVLYCYHRGAERIAQWTRETVLPFVAGMRDVSCSTTWPPSC